MITLNLLKHERSTQFSVPESWNELDGKQLLQVAHCLFGGFTGDELRLRLLVILMGLPYELLVRLAPEIIQEQLYPLMDWMISGECELTKQLLPRIASFVGPEECLYNLRMIEFAQAESELASWYQEKDINNLWRFVACLYRPKRWLAVSKDKRTPFNQDKIEIHAQRLQKLPVKYAYAVLLWYRGCMNFLKKCYPEVFNPGDTTSDEGEAQSAPMFRLMRAIAKEAIYGDFDKVEQLYLYTALEGLQASIDEREARERFINEQTSRNETF